MAMIATRILRTEHEVRSRLTEMQLDQKRLLSVRTRAFSASTYATPSHSANAAGTFAYHEGVFALRDEFVGEHWRLDRQEGVEAIRNDTLKIKVGFANVDVCVNDDHQPKPRSEKGAGTARFCLGNLFGTLPHFAPRQTGRWTTYYLMMGEKGAAELSLPIVGKGTFLYQVERIYLSDGSDLDRTVNPLDDSDSIKDFDPQVARK